MLKINQYYVPREFEHFHEKGNSYVPLMKQYADRTAPTFFYSTLSVNFILETHLGPAVLIVNNMTGKIEERLKELKNRKDLYFISTSKLMSVYLDHLGLKYTEFPWHVGNFKNINSVPKGKSIYFYESMGRGSNFYGYKTLRKILKKNFPEINVHYASFVNNKIPPFVTYTRDQLNEVYKDIFLGIRLTQFDGLSDTVQSLGLLGIKTIWNGGTPSALSYENENDIINHIKNEMKTIGFNDKLLSDTCKNFLNPNNSAYMYIFDLDFYRSNIKSPLLFHNDKPLTFQGPWSKLMKNYNSDSFTFPV